MRVFDCSAVFGQVSVEYDAEVVLITVSMPVAPRSQVAITIEDPGLLSIARRAAAYGEAEGCAAALAELGAYLERHWFEYVSPVLAFALRSPDPS